MFQRFRKAIGACLILLLAVAPQLDAQTLRGRVLDAESGAAVAGAIVKALGPGGQLATGTLTDDAGAFTLTTTGGFQVAKLTVERIGYSTQSFEPARFDGPGGIELLVTSSAVELAGIVATGESFCGARFRNTGSVQTIWDEARKSLEITALSRATRGVGYEVENFERDLRPSDYRALRGSANRSLITSERPYRSVTVEQMTESGWIDGTIQSGMRLYAPDASVLLTDEFASQHCFRGELTPEAVLLHFVPNQERRTFREIEGTLVLNPETAELVELEFRYVGIPEWGTSGHAGGEITFFAAPNGLRVVREWTIRAPALTRYRSGLGSLASEQLRVDYVHEEGGRVLAIQTRAATIRLPVEPLDLGVPGGDRTLTERQVAFTRASGPSGAMELVLRNNDPTPFRVTHVQLRECVNTAVRCGDYPTEVVIAPGQTAVLFRVRQNKILEPFTFEWDYVGTIMEEAATEGVDGSPGVEPEN